MEPKTRLDFLIEEFFNTGKLNLNKKDEGITFDQLPLISSTNKFLIKESRSAWDMFWDELKYGAAENQDKNYKDALDHNNRALKLYDDSLSDQQRDRIRSLDRQTILNYISKLERLIKQQPIENENDDERIRFDGVELDRLDTLFAQQIPLTDKSYYKNGKGWVAQYYMNIERGVEEQKGNRYNTALQYFKKAQNLLDKILQGTDLEKKDLPYAEEIDGEIQLLSGKYPKGDRGVLPTLKIGQRILDDDEYWLKLLNKGEGIEVEVEMVEAPRYGQPYKIFRGIKRAGNDDLIGVNEEIWGEIFCSEANYRRYEDVINNLNLPLQCNLFKGDPKFYNFEVGDEVEFKRDINYTNAEKKYQDCKGKWQQRRIQQKKTPAGSDIKIGNLEVMEKSYDGAKVTLSYDYGTPNPDPISGCGNKGILKDVQISKLQPAIIDPQLHTYGGIEDSQRAYYELNPTLHNLKLKLSDEVYYILNNELREFAAQLQRLGIDPGGWDFRETFKKFNPPSEGKYSEESLAHIENSMKWRKEMKKLNDDKESANSEVEKKNIDKKIEKLERSINIMWDPPPLNPGTVVGIYQKLKDKIFGESSTAQVELIIPYLIEINEKLVGQNRITKSKIIEFIDEIDFNKPEKVEDVFQKIVKSVSSQYEYYWQHQTLYFEKASDKGSAFIAEQNTSFNDKVMDIIRQSYPKTKDTVDGWEEELNDVCLLDDPQLKEGLLNKYADELYKSANKDSYIDKFDIKCIRPIEYNGNTIITIQDYLDVKSKSSTDDFLGEISTPFKNSDFGNTTVDGTEIKRKHCKAYMSVYNQLVDTLLEKMVTGEMTDHIKNNVLGGDRPFRGLIIKDNIFVPVNSMRLYWSNKGWGSDHRLSLRYKIDGPAYKIEFDPHECEAPDCNQQTYTVTPQQLTNNTGPQSYPSTIFTPAELNENMTNNVDNYISEVLGF